MEQRRCDLSYTCTDALSGVATCPSSTSVITEGSSQITSGAATDNAGNSATTAPTVQIDKTPPVVTISSPADGTVFASNSITVTGSVSDSLSGIASATCNGAPASFAGGTVSCAVTLVAGPNSISISALDAAGNLASQTVTVQFQSGPVISGINPTSGGVGTTIVISGSGFGQTPSSDSLILIGSIVVTPSSWSDTSISFVVPATSAGGVVSVSIGGTTVTGPTFTVSGRSTSPTVFLSPSQLSLVVGDTYTPDAFDTSGAVLHGLPWSSSDLTIIELSSDDPPILIAKATGTATITAGTATSTITVYPGPTLPVGTVKWKVPDDGRGVRQIIPAVPSATGVADVFTLTGTYHVQAITPDGHIAWTAWPNGTVVPDFQGGFIDVGSYTGGVIQKYDGMTGQPLPAYTLQGRTGGTAAVHTDGTVFALEAERGSIVVVNPLTSQAKAHVPMQTGTATTTNDCPNAAPPSSTVVPANWYVSRLTIAGDGYFYFNYIRENDSSTTHCEETDAADGSIIHKLQSGTISNSIEYRVLRIASDGTFNDLPIYTYPFGSGYTNSQDRVQTGTDPNTGQPIYGYKYHSDSYNQDTTPWDYGDLITNADQGIYLIWSNVSGGYSGGYSDTDASGHVTSGSTNSPATFAARITPITGGQMGIDVPLPWLPSDQARGRVDLNLQLQNGDFIAQRDYGRTVMALNAATGDLHWSKSGLGYFTKLLYALSDGTMVYRDNGQLATLDAGGNEVSRITDDGITYSWKGAYKKGSTISVVQAIPSFPLGYAAIAGGPDRADS